MAGRNRAVVLTELKTLEFREVPMPEAKPGEILMKLGAVGVCGSDVHYYSHGRIGDYVVEFPFILGHECAGTVVAVGEGVRHLAVGDRVALEPGVPCGTCEFCRGGHYNLCPDVKFFATPPYDGCLMDYVAFPAEFAFKLPDSVSLTDGALIEPLAIGINAALTGGVKLGDSVLIYGAGCIGLVSLLAAKAYGAAQVIVADMLDVRLEAARKLGAITVNSKEADVVAEVMRLTDGKGCEVVLDCAGFSETVTGSIRAAKAAGKIVLVGMGTDELNGIPLGPISAKELTLTSIFRYKNLYPVAIKAVQSGAIDISGIVSNTYPFEQTPEAFKSAHERAAETVKNVIVF
ncbi:NAD(P)-dependent alcohol dehydrogenase [Bacillota bacterium Meth-B3]|nr:NAD(P)-dependent alcohol dehydrogenase [Christensenellaceae bacterium]MEA5066777.1 NAD(P)-dependent alcohol dehydrogenase [Eubacteriales bacterium]MEA5068016.1 NAD(P)-dependent alcohol dehydrogenase [Christensenellaceae bacterium]